MFVCLYRLHFGGNLVVIITLLLSVSGSFVLGQSVHDFL